MLRKILVPLEVSEGTPAATQMAINIAQDVHKFTGQYQVSLRGLGVVDLEQIPTGRFAALVPRDDILAEAYDTAEKLMNDFRKQVESAGIPAEMVEAYLAEGNPCRKITHQHVFADLVVMSDACSFPPALHDYDTLVSLMFEASRPLIIVPKAPQPVRTVVMLMDGTAPSSRMLYAFAHLNPFPQARVLVVHAEQEERDYNLKDFFERLGDYLETYKFDVEQHRLQGQLYEVLPAFICEHGADLIATGVHREQMLYRFAAPLRLMRLRVEDLLKETGSSLFLVH